ncbi:Vacuolar sorting protein 39 domain 2 [Gracilaria domingensis]|nr:Vacuolar sorting protein 39 domain 2 [Gracilaria domingensis]
MFSVATLGLDLVAESFRVALAKETTILLLHIDLVREKVTLLGDDVLPERIASVAFSEMTIVVSTSSVHHLLRISRGGVLAVAATVKRSENQKRQSSAADGGTAVLSLIGGFFWRRGLSAVGESPVAFALLENRWLLRVDEELVTYSSFGEKLEEIENVFKIRSGMDISDSIVSLSTKEETSSQQARGKERSNSMSLLAPVATGITNRTVLDEALAKRAERPPQSTIFSSPFVLSISANNEVMAFAANGLVQGVMEQIRLFEDNDEEPQVKHEQGARLLICRYGRNLAIVFWPSGRIAALELVDDLETLIDEKEAANELRLALSLVPAEQVDRMLSLRRLLAVEARNQDWHDAAIYRMQNIVNTVIKREENDPELISEAVELRGDSESSWQSDDVIATMWADFLFSLRRQIMRPSKADVDILEALCRADASASRVRSLLQSKHGIPLSVGESLITAKESMLRQEEQIDALVALYTSLLVHEKALTLLENSDVPTNFNGVSTYLSTSMRPSENPEVYFTHLKWLAHRAHSEAQGPEKLQSLIQKLVRQVKDSDDLLGRTFEVLVEEADVLLEEVVDEVCKLVVGGSGDGITEADTSDFEHTEKFSGDVIALALLAGMARANSTSRDEVFQSLRSTFGTRILYHPDATYHSYTLLQALQKPEYKALGLREELAYLLGRQGRHEAAADELAAEVNLAPQEALTRLVRMSPGSDRANAVESLVAAYLRVSAQGRVLRIKDASNLLMCSAGSLEIEKLLLDGRCSDKSLSLSDMFRFLEAALVSGNERHRLGEMLRAMKKSEVRRLREKVLTRRRRVVVIGHDRACTLRTRRIGTLVFVAYPDGSVAHYACHISRDNQEVNVSQ